MIALFFLMACGEKTTTDNSLLDEDNDGVVASADCNDSDPSLLEIENDSDCDGFINEEDCGPDDASIYPGAADEWYDGIDSDCANNSDFDQDFDGEDSIEYDGTDCDDRNGTVNTNAVDDWYDGIDSNCDGLSDYDQDGDGVDNDTDCDDEDSTSYPGNTEVWYNDVDNDCSGGSDYDQDGDGVDNDTDCDDEDSSSYPGNTEVWYNDVDNDCSGGSDYDQDGDGVDNDTDCDDEDNTSYPGNTEVWYNDVDNDCSGGSDYDQDGDGVDNDTDCDDEDGESYPGNTEVWYNDVDNDCSGGSDYDQDGDGEEMMRTTGLFFIGTDCDDTDPNINTEADETWYDGVDSDCSGGSDYDQDGDGVDNDTDCDDEDSTSYPGNTEVWYNDVDNDCSGGSDYDQDGDGHEMIRSSGFYFVGTDCDDTNADRSPDEEEVLGNGIDDDCDLEVDEFDLPLYDNDNDGYFLGDDCDDYDPTIHPNATEYCDEIDQDCDGNPYTSGLVSFTSYTGEKNNFSVNTSSSDHEFINVTNLSSFSSGRWDFCDATFYAQIQVYTSTDIYGHGDVTINGSNTYPVFYIVGDNRGGIDVNIDGMTVENGENTNYVDNFAGTFIDVAGGVICDSNSIYNQINLTISNANFVDNEGKRGGHIYADSFCNLVVDNVDFSGGIAESGAGIYALSNLHVKDSSFTTGDADISGGAIFASGNSYFPYHPNGGFEEYMYQNVVHIEDSNINNNSSDYGGGIYLSKVGATISNTMLQLNTSSFGGGIYQTESTTALMDASVYQNIADTGAGIFIYNNSYSTQTNSMVCGGNTYDYSTITQNWASESSAGIHIQGPQSSFTTDGCYIGDNTGEPGYGDIHRQVSGGAWLNINNQHYGVYTEDDYYQKEYCFSTSDNNSNGLYGFDDPWCSIELETNYHSQQAPDLSYIPTCMPAGTESDNFVAHLETMELSGCVETYLSVAQDVTSYVEISDEDYSAITCETGDYSYATSGYLEKGKDARMVISFPEDQITNFQVSYDVAYGQDCDGNCCYDIQMLDSFGDGWNGATLDIFKGFSLVDTITLEDGFSEWTSFCTDDSSLQYWFSWNNTDQEYDDTESIYIYQGDWYNPTCVTIDPSYGILSDCGTNGLLTCSN